MGASKVTAANHWIFAGTGVKNGDIFGTKSLHERIPGGVFRHETDKTSPTSPANTEIVAHGLNPNQSGAEIIYYQLDSGGGVFSTGSTTYPASILVDDVVSRITANVIERLTTI